MQKKSHDRLNQRQEQDRKLGIIAETGRSKKMMQHYFENKIFQKKEDKRLRMDFSNRGLNLHRHTDFKFKDGALNLVDKEKVKFYSSDKDDQDQSKSAFGILDSSKQIRKQRLTYDQIQKERLKNPEFGTGKKFKRSKGSSKKLNKKR